MGPGLGASLVRAPLPLLLGSSGKVLVATPRQGAPAASARMGEQFGQDKGEDLHVEGVRRQEVAELAGAAVEGVRRQNVAELLGAAVEGVRRHEVAELTASSS